MKRNKIFLLFGSTGSLGKTAVDYFLDQEYDCCYFFARKEFDLPVSDKNNRVLVIENASDEKIIEKAFSKVEIDKNSEYHLLSTIGGFQGGAMIKDSSPEQFDEMINVNLKTSFLIAKYFARLTEKIKSGSICFISSQSSLKATKGKAAYNISKAGLNMLVESLAAEGSEINLRANAVAPFAIDTPANREWISGPEKLVSPLEICRLVKSIFDDEKVTGKIIQMDDSSD